MKQLELPVDGEPARAQPMLIPESTRTELVRQMARLLLSLVISTHSEEEGSDSQPE